MHIDTELFGIIVNNGELYRQNNRVILYTTEAMAIKASSHTGWNIAHVVPIVVEVDDETNILHTWTRR